MKYDFLPITPAYVRRTLGWKKACFRPLHDASFPDEVNQAAVSSKLPGNLVNGRATKVYDAIRRRRVMFLAALIAFPFFARMKNEIKIEIH